MHWYSSFKGVTLWWVIYSSLRKQPFFSAPAPITLGEEGRLFLQARIISGIPSWSKKICSQSDFIMLLIVVYWTSVVCNTLAPVQDWPHLTILCLAYVIQEHLLACCPFLFFRENFTVVARLALNSVSSRPDYCIDYHYKSIFWPVSAAFAQTVTAWWRMLWTSRVR